MYPYPPCPECGSKTWPKHLSIHVGEGVYVGASGYKCERCNHTFTTDQEKARADESGKGLMDLLHSGNFDL